MKTNRFRVLVVLAAVVLAASLLMLIAAGKRAQAAFPGPNGLIAFTSDRDTLRDSTGKPFLDSTGMPIFNDEVYVMNSDGSKTIRLTNTPDPANKPPADNAPVLSPDGTKVAFVSNRDDPHGEIYLMDAKDEDRDDNGDNLTRLTNHPGIDGDPAWSPDGKKIAFTRFVDDNNDGISENGEVFVMNEDGSNPTRLTKRTGFDGQPVFSPDGTKIAFLRTVSANNNEVFMMNSDGSEPQNLTNHSASDSQPDFSPDGTQIAFRRILSGSPSNSEVFVMDSDPDTADVARNLTNNSASDQYPAWSPDGTKIAFWRGGFSDGEIYVMDSNSTTNDAAENLTNNNDPEKLVGDIHPDWGPDSGLQ